MLKYIFNRHKDLKKKKLFMKFKTSIMFGKKCILSFYCHWDSWEYPKCFNQWLFRVTYLNLEKIPESQMTSNTYSNDYCGW